MPPKSKKLTGLGKSIIRDRFKGKNSDPLSVLHTTDIYDSKGYGNLQSITQEKDLDAFLRQVELSGTEFTAEKLNIQIIANTVKNPYLLSEDEEREVRKKHEEFQHLLTIPRRPKWSKDMTAEQVDYNERQAFLEWRRSLVELEEQEKLLLTPFEKNIQVWRQLWRVVEKSDLIVQIVDARNPLLFLSSDLNTYVHQIDPNKKNFLLINKSDLLTQHQRESWKKYFIEQNIQFAFFSAKEILESEENEKDPNDSVTSNLEAILTPEQLITLFLKEKPDVQVGQKPVIGLVGYPNVGKSSTINSLIGVKKVATGSTPGKTKHFQTIHLGDDLILCDCPGLVFPSFSSTKAELVCNGILPIDQLREFTGPTALVLQRIPKWLFELIYGIVIVTKSIEDGGSDIPTPEELLNAYARARGFMKSVQGNPDEARAARYILKDYVNAKLIYNHPPPNYSSPETFNDEIYDPKRYPEKAHRVHQNEFGKIEVNKPKNVPNSSSSKIDTVFFSKQTSSAKTKGKYGSQNFSRVHFPHHRQVDSNGRLVGGSNY